MSGYKKGIFFAVLAAALYAVSTPVMKILLASISPAMSAGFLYLGAGVGMAVVRIIRKAAKKEERTSDGITKKELPFVIAMVILDTAAPVLLMFGLTMVTAATASLLNNLEIVFTAVTAVCFFREKISLRLWLGIAVITVAGILLSAVDFENVVMTSGALMVVGACALWGIENNCTKKLSSHAPDKIVVIKGLCSGSCSIIIALILGEKLTNAWSPFACMALGFAAYGLSIYCYVSAQRRIGAARTSAYYAVAPFISVMLSAVFFGNDGMNVYFYIALGLMLLGSGLSARDSFVNPISLTRYYHF